MKFLAVLTILGISHQDANAQETFPNSLDGVTFTGRLKTQSGIGSSHPCPDGWEHRFNKCYKLFTDTKTFDAAEAVCRTYKNGHLTSVLSQAEHEFLLAYILRDVPTDKLKYVWVGGKRFKSRYIWMDLEPFTTVKWHAVHDVYTDTAHPTLNCVQFVTTAQHYASGDFGTLVNHPCTGEDNFICQQPVVRDPPRCNCPEEITSFMTS